MIDVETIARKWANVYELALPADLEGGYDAANNRILISDRLTPIQRRCVLAHEISHARHHDVGCKCDSATEYVIFAMPLKHRLACQSFC